MLYPANKWQLRKNFNQGLQFAKNYQSCSLVILDITRLACLGGGRTPTMKKACIIVSMHSTYFDAFGATNVAQRLLLLTDDEQLKELQK